jgi:hypothetical protein
MYYIIKYTYLIAFNHNVSSGYSRGKCFCHFHAGYVKHEKVSFFAHSFRCFDLTSFLDMLFFIPAVCSMLYYGTRLHAISDSSAVGCTARSCVCHYAPLTLQLKTV